MSKKQNAQIDIALQVFAQGIEALKGHRKNESADIKAVLNPRNPKFGFTEQTAREAFKYGIDAEKIKGLFTLPQKQVKRVTQMINALSAKNYKGIDATSATALYALHLAPDTGLSYDSLHFAVAGVARADGAGGDTKGVSVMRLRKLFNRVGVNSVSSQKSRTFGDAGFADYLGMSAAPHGKVDHMVTLNRSHPMVVALVSMVEGATDAQIDEIGATEKGDE